LCAEAKIENLQLALTGWDLAQFNYLFETLTAADFARKLWSQFWDWACTRS